MLKIVHFPKKQRIEILDMQEPVFLSYKVDGNNFEIVHIELSESLRQKGLDVTLTEIAYDWANSQSLNIKHIEK